MRTSTVSMADFVAFMQAFLQNAETTTKRTGKAKAKPTGKAKAKPTRKATPQQKAAYLALKAQHGGRIPRDVYLAAKAAGSIG